MNKPDFVHAATNCSRLTLTSMIEYITKAWLVVMYGHVLFLIKLADLKTSLSFSLKYSSATHIRGPPLDSQGGGEGQEYLSRANYLFQPGSAAR